MQAQARGGVEHCGKLLAAEPGTDGFGRSDYRKKLRHFFEVDRHWVTLAALESLAKEGAVPVARVAEAIEKYGINPEKANPAKV